MKKSHSFIWALKVFFASGKQSFFIILLYLLLSLIPSVLLIINKNIFESFSADVFSLKITLCLLCFYVSFQIISLLLSFFQKLLMSRVRHRIQVTMQNQIFEKMMRMDYIELDNPDTMDLIQRISNNAPNKSASAIFLILDIVGVFLQIVTAIVVLIDIHWAIPILLIVFTIPYVFLYKQMCFDNYFKEVNQGKRFRQDWYLIKMLFDKHYNKELKIYDCFDYLGDKERKINEDLHGENYSIAKKFSWQGVVLDIIKSIGKAISMLATILLIIYRNVGISAFTVLVQAMDSMQSGLKDVFSKIKDFGALFLVFDDYRKLCEIKDEAETFKPVLADESKPIIEFKDVSFGYPTKPDALKEINLKINAGEKIAVVGKNGSGKTTLINTLLGFYKPVNGEILIMGTPLQNCLNDFRKRTIYIMQNIPRYSASIKENVSLGRSLVNEHIAGILDIDSIIDKAPRKGETMLGEENEDRYNISGGEWSKLGIMRNSQKEDPFLYIMDEPTAALDPIAESNIFHSFHRITDSKTSIFISHRLGMTKLADRIVVLDKGIIAEQGSHDELMHLKGLYYEMYTEQLKLYKR